MPPPDPEDLLAESGWVRAVAGGLVGETDADDLTQETLVRALARPPARRAALHGWLSTVLHNLAWNLRRGESARASREAAVARPGTTEPADDTVARLLLQRRVVDAVLALEEPYRTVVTLRYLEGLEPRRIAERLGVSGAVARKRLSRALAMLRARLDREYGDERERWFGIAALAARGIREPGPAASTSAPPIGGAVLGGVFMTKLATIAVGTVAIAALVLWMGRSWDREASEARAAIAGAGPLAASDAAPLTPGVAVQTPDPSDRVALDPLASVGPFEVDRERDLFGVVLDPDDDAIPGARIRAVRQPVFDFSTIDVAAAKDVRVVAETTSDAAGRFKIPLALGRPYRLLVEAEGFALARVGGAHAGERVEGLYRVWADHHGLRREVTVRVPGGGTVAGIRLVFAQGGTISGQVVGPDGAPVEGVSVGVASPRPLSRLPRTVETDALGCFSIEDLEDGTYRVDVEPHPEDSVDGLLLVNQRLEDVPAGTTGLILQLERARLVRGIVLDPDGKPVPGAVVSASVGERILTTATTEEDGRFEVHPPEGITIDLLASMPVDARDAHPNPDARAERLGVTPDVDEVELVLAGYP